MTSRSVHPMQRQRLVVKDLCCGHTGWTKLRGPQQRHCFLEPVSPCESQGKSLQGTLWDTQRIFGHFLPQPSPDRVCGSFPARGEWFSALEGSCPSPRPWGKAQGCPHGHKVSREGYRVTQGAWCASTRGTSWAGHRHAWLHAGASGWGKYEFVPGWLPVLWVRHRL